MPDRRESLIEAAIAAVREGGYPALTQPKVAALAGMSQSHLTYYFPTRSDLVKAVAERIVRAQLERIDAQPASAVAGGRDQERHSARDGDGHDAGFHGFGAGRGR